MYFKVIDEQLDLGLTPSLDSSGVWNFFKATIPIQIMYDESVEYDDEFVSAYTEAFEFVNKVYSENFGIEFEVLPTPIIYNTGCQYHNSSCSISCQIENTATIPCTEHHKNIFRIADEIYEMTERGGICVLFSDRDISVYCEGLYSQHIVNTALAVVCRGYPIVQILRLSEHGDYADADYLKFQLVHEIAHTFGMPDVYGYLLDHKGGYMDRQGGMLCFMSECNFSYYRSFVSDVEQNTSAAFCSYCKEHITDYIAAKVFD